MTKLADERQFDADGNLVAGVGDPIPEGRSDLKPLQVDPAAPAQGPREARPRTHENRS